LRDEKNSNKLKPFIAATLTLLIWAPILRAQDVSTIEAIVKEKKADPETEALLVGALQDPDTNIHVKERAAWAIGQLDLRQQVHVLVEAARSKSLLVRSAALDALTRMRARTGLPVYIDIAKNDPVLPMRQKATIAMGLLRWEETIPPLVALSRDGHIEIRGASALAMAATHSKRNDFTQALQEMTEDPSNYVQERALKGLDVVNRKKLSIQEHLQSADPDIRLFAALYFHYHGRPSDLKIIKEAHNVEALDEVRFELDRALQSIQKRMAREKARREQLERKRKEKARQERERKEQELKAD